MVTSEGRLTPPFHPLTWVKLAAWAAAGTTDPSVATKSRRALRELGIIFENLHVWVRKRHLVTDWRRHGAGEDSGRRASLPTRSFVPRDWWRSSRSTSRP